MTSKQTAKIYEDSKSIYSSTEKKSNTARITLWSHACVYLQFPNHEHRSLRTCCLVTGWCVLVSYGGRITDMLHLQVQTFVIWSFWQPAHTNQFYSY